MTDESVAEIDLHIATGRDKREEVVAMASGPPPVGATATQAMRHKLGAEAGRAVYKMRKAIVEPVFGQIKEQRGFRRFSLRGLTNVRHEWKLVCAVSNLRKLFVSGWRPQTASRAKADPIHALPRGGASKNHALRQVAIAHVRRAMSPMIFAPGRQILFPTHS